MAPQHIVTSVVMFGVMLFVAGFIYDDQPKRGPTPLSERCSELGGEWLYKSADLLCLMPDGSKLSYSAAEDTFLPFEGGGGLIQVAQASSLGSLVKRVCQQERDPDFSDLPVEVEDVDRPIVDFSSHEAALHYRTAITKDVARGVNFGGKYVVSTWGCGEGCVGSAVIDVTSGFIASYGLEASRFDFQPDSLLLKVDTDTYYTIDRHATDSALMSWDEVCGQGR